MSWSLTTPTYRSKILLKVADLIESNSDDFALAESKDQGKPVNLAKTVDIPRCVLNFRFFATAILHDTNKSTVISQPVSAINYVTKHPVGVAGLISPWNLPLYLLTFKMAPALATGNTVVAKPSEFTSVTSWMLAKVLNEAGLPPGVVNFVFGTGPKAGEALVTHPNVPLISFTGSTATGQRITEKSAPFYKKLSLEMGGKNACIVFDDFDYGLLPNIVRRYFSDHPASFDVTFFILRSCYANQGEICLCSSRIFVQRKIYDRFVKDFLNITKNLKTGDPRNHDTDLGALISSEHRAKVQRFVDDAKSRGCKVLCGDEQLSLDPYCKDGYFMAPVALSEVQDSDPIMQEEVFGPVVCILPFENDEEVIYRANNVKYGLSASVWSKSVERLTKISQALQVGTVWCNCWLIRDLNMPFGGSKASGIGREGADDSIEFYTERKTTCIKID
uniref:Aldehyde dehydrogenase domain-containing protein n=1 Tax=Romanomermis culicivorax TaxID=13658 RepID=A0A915K5B9_ROMCU